MSRAVRSIGVLAPGRAGLLEAVEPDPQDGEAWVETVYSGISAGTEIALLRGTDPHHRLTWDREARSFGPVPPGGSPHAGYPVRGLGYMEVARVAQSRAPGLPDGALVASAYGHQTGRTVRPGRDVVVSLPPDLDPVLGVYVAQMGPIAANGLLHAAAEAAVRAPGEVALADGVRDRHVLVTGAGVVGLLTALFASFLGAAEVVVADPDPRRRRLADALGLAAVDDGPDDPAWAQVKRRRRHGSGDHGADVAFQCRGQAGALATALKALRPQGTVVDLAFYQGGAGAVHLGEEFHHNGLTVRCAQIGRVPRGLAGAWTRDRLCAATLDLLDARGGDVREHLVTDLVPFDEGPALLEDVSQRRRAVVQAVLTYEDA